MNLALCFHALQLGRQHLVSRQNYLSHELFFTDVAMERVADSRFSVFHTDLTSSCDCSKVAPYRGAFSE